MLVGDEQADRLAAMGCTDADAVETAVVTQGDAADLVDLVGALASTAVPDRRTVLASLAARCFRRLPTAVAPSASAPPRTSVEEALVALAHRHVAYGYRRVHAKLRRAGYRVNRKRVQRLLRLWGYGLSRRQPHPKAQGRPFDITANNQLWQTDMTSVWCGENGWCYFTAVVDCFDRSILGWSFTTRCRACDVSPSLEAAWSAT